MLCTLRIGLQRLQHQHRHTRQLTSKDGPSALSELRLVPGVVPHVWSSVPELGLEVWGAHRGGTQQHAAHLPCLLGRLRCHLHAPRKQLQGWVV